VDRGSPTVGLPKEAILVELRADQLTFESRKCLLPGTRVLFTLVMEGQPLPLKLPVRECLVTERDRLGYIYHARIGLDPLPEPDRQLINLYIAKGRGSPELAPWPEDK
jgi:hypothetical protein